MVCAHRLARNGADIRCRPPDCACEVEPGRMPAVHLARSAWRAPPTPPSSCALRARGARLACKLSSALVNVQLVITALRGVRRQRQMRALLANTMSSLGLVAYPRAGCAHRAAYWGNDGTRGATQAFARPDVSRPRIRVMDSGARVAPLSARRVRLAIQPPD